MDAGKEMDALVAEKVMGFRRRKTPKDINGQNGGDDILVPPNIDHNTWNYPPKGKIAITYFVPNYSTDITAAFEVVDKMAELGHDFDLFYHVGFEMPWTARFPAGVDNLDSHENNTAKTAPLAICKAALRAVGVAW